MYAHCEFADEVAKRSTYMGVVLTALMTADVLLSDMERVRVTESMDYVGAKQTGVMKVI